LARVKEVRAYEATRLVSAGTSFFLQQRLQRAAQQLAESSGDSLPVAGLAVLARRSARSRATPICLKQPQ
jgi:hypothetical protein